MLASLKTLNNSKDWSENCVKFLYEFLLSYGRFSTVYIHGRLVKKFSGSQAAFEATFRVTDSYWKAGTGFLKRVTGGFSKL